MGSQAFEIDELSIGVVRILDAVVTLLKQVFPCGWTFQSHWPISVERIEAEGGLVDKVHITQPPLFRGDHIECALCSKRSNYPGTPLGGRIVWSNFNIPFLVRAAGPQITLFHPPDGDYRRWIDPGRLLDFKFACRGLFLQPLTATDFKSRSVPSEGQRVPPDMGSPGGYEQADAD